MSTSVNSQCLNLPMFGWSSAVFIDLAIQAARETMK